MDDTYAGTGEPLTPQDQAAVDQFRAWLSETAQKPIAEHTEEELAYEGFTLRSLVKVVQLRDARIAELEQDLATAERCHEVAEAERDALRAFALYMKGVAQAHRESGKPDEWEARCLAVLEETE